MNRHSAKVGMFSVPLLLTVLLTAFTAQATEVSACVNEIETPDTFFLTQDITNANNFCFEIFSPDIYLDCQGFNISTIGSGGAVSGPLFMVSDSSSNVTIKNCNFFGAGDSVDAGGNIADSLLIQNNSFINMTGTCLTGMGGTNVVINGNHFECGVKDVEFTSATSSVFITNNTLVAGDDCISQTSGDEETISGNVLLDCGDSGIEVNGTNILLENNTFLQGDFFIDMDGTSSNINITENFIGGWDSFVVSYAGGGADILFFNNWLTANSDVFSFSDGGIGVNTTLQSGVPITNEILGLNNSLIGGNYYVGVGDACEDSEPDGICDSSVVLSGAGNTDFLPLSDEEPSAPSEPEEEPQQQFFLVPIILLLSAVGIIVFTIRNLTSCHSLDSKKIAETCVLTIVLVALLSIAFTIA